MNGIGIAYSLQGSALYVRPITSSITPPRGLSGRSKIRKFSIRSAARMRRYLRCCDAKYSIMGTLTYPAEFPRSGRVCKGHFRAFAERCRRYYRKSGKDGWSIFWFIEFQQRGAPHFHFFATHEIPRDLLAVWWYDIVDSQDRKHLLAGTRIEYLRNGRSGAIAYASKYAAKMEQKEVPLGFEDVGRFWGAIGLVSCHAFFMLVRFDDLLSETHKLMQDEIRKALKRAQGRWRRMNFGEKAHLIRGIVFKDEDLRNEVEGILHRCGLMGRMKKREKVVECQNLEII